MGISLKVKRLSPDAVVPIQAHDYDAGFDLCATGAAITIEPFGRAAVPTGLAFEIPRGYEMQVRPRSGLALKKGLTVLNSPGTIDAGYRGEVKVILHNTSKEPVTIAQGDRIAQAVVARVESVTWTEVAELSDSSRGSGGFGSTG